VEIGRMSPVDAPSIMALAKIVHQLHVDHQPECYRAVNDDLEFERWIVSHLSAEGAVGLWVRENGIVLGYLIAIVSKIEGHLLFADRSILTLDEICVHPDYRRRGIADMLMEELKKEGRRQGAETIRSSYASFNKASHSFFEKHGMVAKRTTCEGIL